MALLVLPEFPPYNQKAMTPIPQQALVSPSMIVTQTGPFVHDWHISLLSIYSEQPVSTSAVTVLPTIWTMITGSSGLEKILALTYLFSRFLRVLKHMIHSLAMVTVHDIALSLLPSCHFVFSDNLSSCVLLHLKHFLT